MARPTRLTPAIEQAILQAVTGGVPYVQAAMLAGVSERTAHLWRERGEGTHTQQRATPRLLEFVQGLK